MANRQKLLEAAARVYGEFGFRGATTRRIADEAGVNEVTLFRLFGSKAALINEALRAHASISSEGASLPETPVDPERELATWCAAQLAHLRSVRAVIRKAMSELAEHPEVAPCMNHAPMVAAQELRRYAARLSRGGQPIGRREMSAACSMLMGALFSDAMGREILPELYAQPEASAPALYARLFLRALGCEAASLGASAAGQSPARRQRESTPPAGDASAPTQGSAA